ncbi:UNVERIFIED_CONTAM: Aspartic proteinase-like protein 2 [Sesamum radiatum]|uniref:Aspartic proteinase-like protein 2 n=1 Tax=Sesamum radiatum TaxID=300843 RepID=A0AAW2NQE0_SESRA
MGAEGFLVMAAVVAMAAAAVVSALQGGGGFQGVLTLERAFPVEGRVELEAIKARDRARHARILQSFSGGIVDFTVGGTSDPYAGGLYYTKVRLGSPPQEFNVQIDTGSDVLWVTCNSCSDCPQNSGLGVKLSLFILLLLVHLLDTWFDALLSNPSFSLGAHAILCFQIPLNFFNAATSSSVSPISCSDNICASMVQLASAECSTESNQCGYSFQYGDGSGTAGFYVSDMLYFDTILGTSLIANSSAPIVFGCSTSLFGDLTKSDRAVDGIFGFGQQGNRGTIIDSGTTLAYLVEGAYDPLVAAITAAVSSSVRLITSKGNQCYLISTSVGETFPAVSFNFAGGASMVLRPIDYLVLMGYLDGAAMWCIGFLKVQNEGTTILGDLVLKDKIFVYDLAHQRIGWADHDCSLSVNVSITSGKDEYVNAGQLSVSRSSSITDIFKTMHETYNALLLHILVVIFIGIQLL